MSTTKLADLDVSEALNTIYHFFKKVSTCCSQSKSATLSEVEDSLARNFELISNGHTVCKHSGDYLSRLQRFQKKYSSFEFSKPLQEPIVQGHRLAFQYKVDLKSHNGQEKEVYISTIASIENHKITRWIQVDHELGTGDWDA
jgi:hypothetical protein